MSDKLYEIFIRKGDQGAVFNVPDEKTVQSFGLMCGIAKELVDQDKVDEAVVIEKRVVRRFKKYISEG